MTEKEIAKVLRRAKVKTDSLVCHDCAIMWEAADTLKSLTAERDALKEQLAAALAENTKLARQLAVKSEQLESLRTIFYEITGSIPSKAHSQKASKEENHA